MNNLKFVAVGLFVVFIGLFTLSKFKKDDSQREVASIEKGKPKDMVEKRDSKDNVPEVVAVSSKITPPPNKNMLPTYKKIESIPEPKNLKKGELPKHKGRLVARLFGNMLLPPKPGSLKDIAFSKGPVADDIEEKANKFFRSLGYDEDKKMIVERGPGYYLINGPSANRVELFRVSYNTSDGESKKVSFLLRSSNGRYWRKIDERP